MGRWAPDYPPLSVRLSLFFDHNRDIPHAPVVPPARRFTFPQTGFPVYCRRVWPIVREAALVLVVARMIAGTSLNEPHIGLLVPAMYILVVCGLYSAVVQRTRKAEDVARVQDFPCEILSISRSAS